MVRNEQILKDILLKMNYDVSKTLSEQDNPRLDGIGRPNYSTPVKPKSLNWSDKYPKECKYQDKVVQHPNIQGYSSKESLIEGFCFYPFSSTKSPGQISGKWVPSNSEVRFWDVADISKYVDQIISNKEFTSLWSGFTEEQIQEIVTNNIVLDTVWSFNVGNRRVTPYFTKTSGSFNPSDVKIKGWFYQDSKEPYIQPKWVDTRSEFDKLIDEYGTAAQIITGLGIAAISIATAGMGGLALLALEIAVEGTLGAIIASRELRKGNKLAAGFEIAFALTPWLKTFKFMRGLDNSVVKSLTSKMGEYGLKSDSSVDEVVSFYRGLSDAEKDAFTKMIKDTSDELTEAELKRAMGKKFTEEIYSFAKKNPNIFKDISWYQKVWAKELGINGIILLFNIASEIFLGENLSEEEERALNGIFLKIPKELSQQITMEILSNPKNVEKFKETMPNILSTMEDAKPNVSSRIDSLANIAMVYDSFNKNGVELNNPKIDDTTSISDGYVQVSIDEYLDIMDGIESGDIDISQVKEMRSNNGDLIYLFKEK